MLKKSLSAALSAALIVSGLPFGAVSAVAANTQSRAGVVPTVSLTGMPGIASPVAGMASMPGANVGMRADNVLPPTLPSARVSAAQAVQAAATAQRQPEAKASVTANVAPALAAAAAPKASAETGRSAIGSIYEGTRLSRSGQAADVAGRESNGTTLPAATGAPSTKRSAGVEQRRSNDGGLIAEVGIGVAALGVLGYIFSPSFRNLVKRAWNAMLGVFGMGVKKMETPEVMAQRIIDQLNEQKPIYNRKVQEASTLVEKLRLQVEGEQKKFDELEKTITALLSDSDPNNDILTTGMIKEQQILKGSIAANKEQVALSEKMLEGIKEERARFFMEREELLAKIQAGLTKSKAAEIQKQMAELKGGFKVGDLKDNLDKFEDAVNDKVADAKGHQDSVESNPDEIIKKAKDSLRNQEVQDEIARRKAEIEAKKKGNGQSGGMLNKAAGVTRGSLVKGIIIYSLGGVLIATVMGFFPAFIPVGMLDTGLRFLAVMAVWAGMDNIENGGQSTLRSTLMIVAGLGTIAAASGIIAPLGGLTAFALGFTGFFFTWRGIQRFATSRKSNDGGLVAEVGIGVAALGVLGYIFSPSFRNLVKRAWNAMLGVFGMGVKKMETPEVMAQRIIDQLNEQKPIYNRKVQEASTLVEKLRLQIEGQEKQYAELDKTITALLSDSDPTNDTMAATMINQQKTLKSSTDSSKEQLAIGETALKGIKEERERFFSEREELLAKIQAGLTKSKAAEIQKQMAELKGGFKVGDLKDNLDKFEDAVNDKVADAKGHQDSVESNPEEIIKKAKDSLRNQEVLDEIARRKAEIEAKKKGNGQSGGKLGDSGIWKFLDAAWTLGIAAYAGLNTGFWAGVAGAMTFAGLGTVGFIAGGIIGEKYFKTSGSKTVGAALLGAVIGVLVGLGGGFAAGYFLSGPVVAGVFVAAAAVSVLVKSLLSKGRAKDTDMTGKALMSFTTKDPGTPEAREAMFAKLLEQGVQRDLGVDPTFGEQNGEKTISFVAAVPRSKQLSIMGEVSKASGGSSTVGGAASGKPFKLAPLKDGKSSDGGSLIATVGIGVAALGVLGFIFSPSFRNLVKRAWNAMLGIFGMGVKKMETPEVMAQRIVDQLNEQKPIYNRKVQEASTLVEKLRLQIEKEQKEFNELDRTITALLSDSDPNNDIMTAGMIKTQKVLESSMTSGKEQLALSEKTLEGIKEERARFFMEREELLAKVQAGLTKSKAAEIQKQMAELKGGFKVGDLKDNLDKFEDAVNDKVADAKGHQDSVESNPDEIIKKAKDSLRNQEVQDEIARRKAEIEAKKKGNGQSGGAVFNAVGWFAKAIAVGFAFLAPTIATFVFAGMGLIALIMEPSKAQSFGRSLAVIGGITLALGGAFAFGAAHFGLAIGAFGSGLGWTVPGLLALTAGIFSAIRARKRGAAVEASMPASTTPTMTPVPSAEPAASSPSTSAPSAKGPSVLKSLGELWKRFWNALLGIFGMGVKKMETPEILAQRMIDQLNAAKPVYNQKVADAASLVEKLKIQIEKQQKTSKELDTTITAILSDSNPDNDHLAAVMIKQKSALDASTAATQEQAAIAAKTLEGIKEERARFFAEREEALAKIQAGLTKAKAAEVQKQMAELKGGFKVGDIGDNMGRFEDAVNDKVSDAKGHQDAVDSNPEEIIKKAKESMRDQEVQDELKRRRDEIAKNKAGK